MANEDRLTERRINLAALRKQDQNADSILDTASSVAHYKFVAATEKWEKTEFEGSMFLYNRQGLETEVAFLVMNRLNKDNLIVTIKPGMEFKLQEPFLLCRTATEIIGIWFYDTQECARISSLLSRIASVSGNQAGLAELINKLVADNERRDAPKKDLMQMFMQAKEEYDKKEIQGENQKKSASTKNVQANEQREASKIRKNSFSQGTDSGTADGHPTNTNQNPSESDTLLRLLQGSKSTEKRPRARTLSYGDQTNIRTDYSTATGQKKPGESFLPVSNSKPDQHFISDFEKSKPIDVAMLEASVLKNSPSKIETARSSNASISQNINEHRNGTPKKVDAKDCSLLPDVIVQSTDDLAKPVLNLMTPSSLLGSKPSVLKTTTSGVGRGRGLASILNITEKRSADQKQQATTPTAQAQAVDAQARNTTPRKDTGLAMKFPEPPPSGLISSLMSPSQFQAAQKPNPAPYSSDNAPLSRQQFQDAIIHMIQNDDSFVERLHNSYLNLTSNSKR